MTVLTTRRFRLKIHPLLFPILLLFWQLGNFGFFLSLLAFVTLHELSHVFVAIAFGCSVKELWITPVGEQAIIRHFDDLSYRRRQFVLLAGPFCSLICGILCYFFSIMDLALINFTIAAFNILPFLPLDGGRILQNAWGKRQGTLTAATALTKISRGFGYVLIILGLIQMILFPFSFSLLIIGCYIVSINRREYLHITYSLYKQLLKKKDAMLPIRPCYIGDNATLGDLTRIMNPDHYFIFYHRCGEFMEQKTQQEIMHLLMRKGARWRVWDTVKD